MTLKIPVTLLKNCTLENKDLVQSSRRTTQMFLEVEHRHISEKDRHALFLACQGQQDKTPELKRLQGDGLVPFFGRRFLVVVGLFFPKGCIGMKFVFRWPSNAGVVHDQLGRALWIDRDMIYFRLPIVFRFPGLYPCDCGELFSFFLRILMKKIEVFLELCVKFVGLGANAGILQNMGHRFPSNIAVVEICFFFCALSQQHGSHFQVHTGQSIAGGAAFFDPFHKVRSPTPQFFVEPVNPLVGQLLEQQRQSVLEGPQSLNFCALRILGDVQEALQLALQALQLRGFILLPLAGQEQGVSVFFADVPVLNLQEHLRRAPGRLHEVLREGIHLSDRDVISGKTGGCLIIIRGDPGLGKTLSAQVFAEENERPLYEVQCAQLGIQPAEVEKNLRKALLRARRWNAILLINEADVYVRKRGEDIVQNAIVGVFLRLLESLDGICFLTTNQGTTIDDAIYSRAMVHLKYDYPDEEGRFAICRDQSKLQKLPITDEVARALTKKHKLSGRDIRQLVKLARLLHLSEGNSIQLKDLEWALQWRDTGLKKKKSG